MKAIAINKEATRTIALALLPGLLFSLFLHDPDYLMASFFSVCAILPFGVSYSSKLMTYVFAIVIMFYSLLIDKFIGQWVIFYMALAIPMTLFSIYECQKKSLKTMSNWWLIAVMYAGFSMQVTPSKIGGIKYPFIFLLTLAGCFFAVYSKKNVPFKLPAFKIDKQHIRYYLKYPLALLLTISVLALYNIQEGQWLIWSCFSVLSLDHSKAKSKYQERLIGVVSGVSIGLVIVKFVPHSYIFEYIYGICILLSLRLFQSYLYSFATRCFLIVLYAGSHYQYAGFARLTDIILGGAIGMVLSYCLRHRTGKIYE
jgi:hypothetical protein